MKKISREFKIGLIVLLSAALLVLGFNYLKGINLFEEQRTFFAIYGNVDGLQPSNPVLLQGLKVGLVKQVRFHPDGSGRIEVEFLIDDPNVNLPSDTRAKIFTSDFFGSKAIDILPGASMVMADSKDTLRSEVEEDLTTTIKNEFEPLKAKINELTSGIDVIVTNLKTVFEDDATQGLPQVFASLQRTMETLEATAEKLDATVADNRSSINGIINNVNAISANIRDNNDELNAIVRNVSQLSDSLAQLNVNQTIRKADAAMGSLAEVMQKVENGEGSLGLLVSSDSLHNEVVRTNQELQLLINDIYENPWRYIHVSIFGKRERDRFSRRDEQRILDVVEEAEKDN